MQIHIYHVSLNPIDWKEVPVFNSDKNFRARKKQGGGEVDSSLLLWIPPPPPPVVTFEIWAAQADYGKQKQADCGKQKQVDLHVSTGQIWDVSNLHVSQSMETPHLSVKVSWTILLSQLRKE